MKNNKNINNYVLLYRSQHDEIKTTINKEDFILDNKNTKNKILVISHESLYEIGSKMFLEYNFLKVIFLPSFLKYYHFLLTRENKTHLIFPFHNIILISNEKICTIYHNNDMFSMNKIKSKINGLILDQKLLDSKYYFSIFFYVIYILRKYNFFIFICNILLFFILVFYLKYGYYE